MRTVPDARCSWAAICCTPTALRLTREIEAEFISRANKLESWVASKIDGVGVGRTEDNPGGLVELDPDRIVDTRFYFATYVTDWDEESAPGPVSDMLEVDQNDFVTVSVPTAPADRNITKWRLYRTNNGSKTAEFQFVDEMLISTLTYKDELKGAQLGEVCPTVAWAEPPYRMDMGSSASIKPPKGPDPYLMGMVGMPNGILAGYIDNFVAFCDPYHPYAWPVEYQISLEYPVTGLGVFGQTLFVGTIANPYLISGSDSASMSAVKLDAAQACVSRRSIVAVQGGVMYASPDGICFASGGGVEVLSAGLFSREDWQALRPETMLAASHDGVYYFWCDGDDGGCYALDMVAKKLVRIGMKATAVFADALTDAVFYCDDSRVMRAFSAGRRTGIWRTGKIVLPQQAGLAWLQVDGDLSASVPAIVRWYGDGVLRHTSTVTSIAPIRLPSGRWLEHEVEIESAARITKVMLASSTAELKTA